MSEQEAESTVLSRPQTFLEGEVVNGPPADFFWTITLRQGNTVLIQQVTPCPLDRFVEYKSPMPFIDPERECQLLGFEFKAYWQDTGPLYRR